MRYLPGVSVFAQPAFQWSPPCGYLLPPHAAAMAECQATNLSYNQRLQDRSRFNGARCYFDDEALLLGFLSSKINHSGSSSLDESQTDV